MLSKEGAPITAGNSFKMKHVVLIIFGLMTLYVLLTRDLTLLDPHSFLRQRYAPIPLLMMIHGIPGALALFLGYFQFSDRIRKRYLQVHRVMGRIYVVSVLISAPVSILVSLYLGTPTLLMASIIQSIGWIVTTGTGLYCIRTHNIQQHREWMTRSYPFAMVFVFVRTITAIPAVNHMGQLGVITTVWSVLATACFLPSFIIAWQGLAE